MPLIRKYKRYGLALILALAVLVIAGAAFYSVISPKKGRVLEIRDAASGRVYGRWPLGESGEFSIEFVHSVHQSPVRETFRAESSSVLPVETRFYSFGAGMQSDLEEGQTMSRDEDALLVRGFNTSFRELNYIVGTVSDHLLIIGDETVSLRELCGRNAHITIRPAKLWFQKILVKKIAVILSLIFSTSIVNAQTGFRLGGLMPINIGMGIIDNKLFLDIDASLGSISYEYNSGFVITWLPLNYKYTLNNHHFGVLNYQVFWNIFSVIPYENRPIFKFRNDYLKAELGPFASMNIGPSIIFHYGIKYNVAGASDGFNVFYSECGFRSIYIEEDLKNYFYFCIGVDVFVVLNPVFLFGITR